MKSTSVVVFLFGFLLVLGTFVNEASAKKRKCSEKPADIDDAVIEKAIEECAEKALKDGGDPEKVLDECAAKLLKDYQDHHAANECGGQTSGFQGFLQKAKTLAKAIKEALTNGSESLTEAISDLHKGLEKLIATGKQIYEGFKKSLKSGDDDEYTNE